MNIEKEKLAVIYDRLAIEELSSNKLAKRKDKLIMFAKQRGYTPVATYADTISGSTSPFNRQQFSKLVSDLPTTKPTAVIIDDYARISRDFGDFYMTSLLLQAKEVELITMDLTKE